MHTFLKFPKLFVVLLVLCLFPKTDQFSVSKQLNRSNSSKAKIQKVLIFQENSLSLQMRTVGNYGEIIIAFQKF